MLTVDSEASPERTKKKRKHITAASNVLFGSARRKSETYKNLLLSFVVNNCLPFRCVDSKEMQAFIDLARMLNPSKLR